MNTLIRAIIFTIISVVFVSCDKKPESGMENNKKDERPKQIRNQKSDLSMEKRVRELFDSGNLDEASKALSYYADSLKKKNIEQLLGSMQDLAQDDSPTGQALFAKCLKEIATRDPDRALKTITEMQVKDSSMAYQEVIKEVGKSKPENLLSWWTGLDSELKSSNAAFSIIYALREDNPEMALEFASSNKDIKIRKSLADQVYSDWVARNPDAAVGYASQQQDGGLALASVAGAFGKSDPYRGLKLIDDLNNVEAAAAATSRIFAAWLTKDQTQAIAELKKSNSVRIQEVLSNGNCMKYVLKADNNTLLDLASKIPATDSSNSTIAALLGKVVLSDPSTGLKWVNENVTGAAKDTTLASIAKNLMNKDSLSASTMYSNGSFGKDEQAVIVSSLAESWGKGNLDDALYWSQNLPSDKQYIFNKNLLESASSAQLDKGLAVFGKITNDLDAASAQEVGKSFGSALGKRNPEDAFIWANKQVGQAQIGAMKGLMEVWMQRDPVAASGVVSRIKDDSARNAAIHSIIETIKDSDPESAALWRKQLTNP